ncbi:MAG: tRNA pseudouridine(38-40) synthase TruA [Bacteroidota bacterium]
MSARYFLKLAYKGTRFSGWQIQPESLTVQECIQNALATILQQRTPVTGCGRTDAGVHASCFFAHFDSNRHTLHGDSSFLYSLNSLLPADIAIYKILLVNQNAHARFDAISRNYIYKCSLRKDPFRTDTHLFLPAMPNLAAIHLATSILRDYEDFKCFSKTHTDVKHYLCNIQRVKWYYSKEDQELIFTITANRFLRNMVRAIVGTLLEIGQEKYKPEQMHAIIKSRNRQCAGGSAKPKGLYLNNITYPDNIFYKIV